MSQPEDHPSSLRDGRYAVCGVIGEGAQATTLDAVDKRDGRPVAIKRFAVRGARSWKEVELAEREARVLSALDHPLLPGAIEHFEEEGALYLVMERIDGRPLASVDRLPKVEVRRFLQDAAEVLEYLHSQGPPVVHRDIKPGNIIQRPARAELGEQGTSYVLVDFGSVRDTLKPEGGSTVVGTFGYMAPEQFQGRALPVSDIYAVGATALRLLTGLEPEKLPHKGLAIDVRGALGDGFDSQWVSVLSEMLRPDPDERAAKLRPLLQRLSSKSPTAPRTTDRRRKARGAGAEPAPSPSRAGSTQRGESEPRAARSAGRRKKRRKQERDVRGQKRDVREQKRDARKQKRAARKRRRHARRPGRGNLGHPIAGFYRPVVAVALMVARIVTAIVLKVLVPTLLTLLSIIFGSPLRRAAQRVQRSGDSADRRLQDAGDRAVGRIADRARGRVAKEEAERGVDGAAEVGERVRVDPNTVAGRVRVAEELPEDDEEELEQAESESRKATR